MAESHPVDLPTPRRFSTHTGSEQKSDRAAAVAKSRKNFTSKSWFNKSFDQEIVSKRKKDPQARTLQRQRSVTDVLQGMFSKSKVHLQELFLSKKTKAKRKENTPSITAEEGRLEERGAVGGVAPTSITPSFYTSCPSIVNQTVGPVDSIEVEVQININPAAVNVASGGDDPLTRKPTSPLPIVSDKLISLNRTSINVRSMPDDDVPSMLEDSPFVGKKSSLPLSMSSQKSFASRASLFPSPKRRKPKSLDLSESGIDDGRLSRGSLASPSNKGSSTRSLLATDHPAGRQKRTLVKSSSDTFAMMISTQRPMSKASSDGNCFKLSSENPVLRDIPRSHVMAQVTDYLFIGSVEAAFNEPLLCKHDISSMIDMTNISPTVVPADKKLECPCTCITNRHFRSRLNIGVDDIEWENMEQYFESINAFIHGARKKGKRVLVFSYNGQSRAATAVIQHLMQHFKMSYKEALYIVRSKRPQVKLNPGFVKALVRLEKTLNIRQPGESPVTAVTELKSSQTLRSRKLTSHSESDLTAPPVVKGAWLEC